MLRYAHPLRAMCMVSGLLITLASSLALAQAQPPRECGCLERAQRRLMGIPTAVRPILSGSELTIQTPHFRIHYTLTGQDATTLQWADTTAAAAETSWTVAGRLGWVLPPPDNGMGGDDRYDILSGTKWADTATMARLLRRIPSLTLFTRTRTRAG